MNRILLICIVSLAACGRGREPATAGSPARVATAAGFKTPEAVKYDGDLDVYFVANINGNPSQKDNNGFISRLSPDGAVLDSAFIAGGKSGATLDAPKGMAVVGDTLWVTDIDHLRGFHKRTGAPVTSVAFRSARFLNDVAAGPDGALYITDTGIHIDAAGQASHPGPDRIFRLGADRRISVAAEGDTLHWPNGITWDAGADRFIVVSFGGPTVYAWTPGGRERAPATIATGPGSFDGVEILADGRALISTWADSSIYVLEGGTLSAYIRGVPAPADLGLDPKRNRVAIPLFMDNRVEVWQIPAR